MSECLADDGQMDGRDVVDVGVEVDEVVPIKLQTLKEGEGVKALIKHTMDDPTLAKYRAMADKNMSGYTWEMGVLVRYRMNELGKAYRQICLPKPFQKKVLWLVHENFGHFSKNSHQTD